MEIVSSYCHLGHIISSSLNYEQDILSRRNAFVGQVNSVGLLCYFGKLPSVVKARLFRSYCTSFYGCVLWDQWRIQDFRTGGKDEAPQAPRSSRAY